MCVHLKLVEQFKLEGQITGLKRIRPIESPHLDYVIVATKLAKFSVIRWDAFHHTISTVSLHYYENCLQGSSFDEVKLAELLVEPTSNSCTCMRFKNMMIFLPFTVMDDEEEEEEELEADTMYVDVKLQKGTQINSTSEEGVVQVRVPMFDSSFLIDAKTLDPLIGSHVIDAQFLYSYSGTTMAVLTSGNQYTWTGLLPQLKDDVSLYIVSLDLKSKVSATVLKVDNLPYDIDRIIPLKAPLNGCVLLGGNEIIHVDNGGIARKIAVNSYFKLITNQKKNYIDMTHLELKLEGCSTFPIDNKLLLITREGSFYCLEFELDGKSIKKVSLTKLAEKAYENIQLTYPGEIVNLDDDLLFISNKNGDSPLVKWGYQDDSGAISSSQGEMITTNGRTTTDDDLYDEDDDLYNDDEGSPEVQKALKRADKLMFHKHDQLINLGPCSTFAFGFYSLEEKKSQLINPNYRDICIFSNGGSQKQSALSIISPTVQLNIKSSLSFSQIDRMWTIQSKYLITSDSINFKSEIFQIDKAFARLVSKSFVNNDMTIAVHEMPSQHVIQVTRKKVHVYESNFKKRAMKLLWRKDANKDESESVSTSVDDEIIHSTFQDEFLMLFLRSGGVLIYSVNTYNGTFTSIAIPKILSETIITTGCIANSYLLNAVLKDINLVINHESRGLKRKHSERNANPRKNSPDQQEKGATSYGPKQKTFALVTGDNRIVVFNRFHNQKCYQLREVDKFTKFLSLEFFENRDSIPDPHIKQIIFNDLGDGIEREEYLTVLTIGGEIYMYKLFFDGENFQFKAESDLAITGAPDNAYPSGTSIERRLVYFPNFSGKSCIGVTGVIPYLITKLGHSIPRIFRFSKIPVLSFAIYSDVTNNITNGIMFLDNKKNARACELAPEFNFENCLPVRRIPMGETIKSIAYHETSNTLVVSTFKEIPYNCIDEDGEPIVGTDPSRPSAISYKGSVKLISPYNWSVIDTIELEDNEVGMTLKSMALDVGSLSKKFKNKKEFIVVGSGKYRLEDLPCNGNFKVIEIIDIIPEPGRPETNHKFKEFFQEDTRGAVTSVSEVYGRFLVAQGQKIIVRDIQDDGAVPVAFLDCPIYVSELKNFGDLVLLGDAVKGVCLAGFDAEPFRMITLGKDMNKFDTNCADFIVKDEDLYILIADQKKQALHLVQYDPEDPVSLNGTRLVYKWSFNVNSTVMSLKSLPKHEEFTPMVSTPQSMGFFNLTPPSRQDIPFQSMGCTLDGSFFTVFPVNEATYRRMYILQQQLTEKEYHVCGLNPRMNRMQGLQHINTIFQTTGNGGEGLGKPLLDFGILKKFTKLNEDRKKNFVSKVSGKRLSVDIWRDLIEIENVLKNMYT
ncbi:mRNA cleavage and polyadenylation factor subunit [Scheffersomyces spartinae]|uniref:mRNA cleavage and polyadenylation factor subunit n=1 Tax=Scheffersomyces spartinae TaxID=45513 RepID=A0A9P8AGK1_9ASCO|nr:mRNA cleavage and polyadenylation factor subunit [Scheffersomyces spartinae]KAG7191485.1 mRNA cleavage and polyadenylation factor subunit [Scheffersomyces spartinae]